MRFALTLASPTQLRAAVNAGQVRDMTGVDDASELIAWCFQAAGYPLFRRQACPA